MTNNKKSILKSHVNVLIGINELRKEVDSKIQIEFEFLSEKSLDTVKGKGII